jgi:hypothetical protein
MSGDGEEEQAGRVAPLLQPPRALAPPPDPQHDGTGRHYLLEQRLSALRDEVWQRARRGRDLCVAAGLILGSCLLLLIATVSGWIWNSLQDIRPFPWEPRLASLSGPELALVLGLPALGMIVAVLRFMNWSWEVGRRFRRDYEAALAAMKQSDLALLFVWEDLHANLNERMDQARLIRLGKPRRYVRLEPHLEHCACHFDSLRRLLRNPEARISPGWLLVDEHLYELRRFFPRQGSTCLLLLIPAVVLWPLLPFLALLYAINGPRYVRAQAVLLAFLDFCLESGS